MVQVESDISRARFYERYVGRRPVLLKGFCRRWPAFEKWGSSYFVEQCGDQLVDVKVDNVSSGQKRRMRIAEYAGWLDGNGPGALYLHNAGFLTRNPQLSPDVEPFPLDFIPSWYAERWWEYTQFFWGPGNSLTPLHFDSLGTHNFFFQIRGKKRFYIIPAHQRSCCYMRDYFWSLADAEKPDYETFPKLKDATIMECLVEGGDAVYLPPFTLHQVRALEPSISLNVDWHTPASVLRALAGCLFDGMPGTRIKYNLCFALGLVFRVPSKVLYPYFAPYLN